MPETGGENSDKAKWRMALNIKIIFLVLIGGTIALFLIQNVADAEIQFLFWSVSMRRSTLVLLALGVGVLIGWILHGIQSRTRRRREDARISTDLAPVSESERMKFESSDSDR
jgi:uncharacterized integral membrane protein